MQAHSVLSEAESAQLKARRDRPIRPRPPMSFVAPASLIDLAVAHLRGNGRDELEQLVLLGGYAGDERVLLVTLLLPETIATWGRVEIVRSEQPKIVDWLYEHGQLLYVEAHTHGSGIDAEELSCTDRKYPAGRTRGFIAIVVTHYAANGIDPRAFGMWEYEPPLWNRVPARVAVERFRIVADREIRDELLAD